MSDKVYAIIKDSKVKIISGTRCSQIHCINHGCHFPECAKTSDEFETLENAKKKYPNITIA